VLDFVEGKMEESCHSPLHVLRIDLPHPKSSPASECII
jgi:hypothetical protein